MQTRPNYVLAQQLAGAARLLQDRGAGGSQRPAANLQSCPVQGLAKAVAAKGGVIYEGTRVKEAQNRVGELQTAVEHMSAHVHDMTGSLCVLQSARSLGTGSPRTTSFWPPTAHCITICWCTRARVRTAPMPALCSLTRCAVAAGAAQALQVLDGVQCQPQGPCGVHVPAAQLLHAECSQAGSAGCIQGGPVLEHRAACQVCAPGEEHPLWQPAAGARHGPPLWRGVPHRMGYFVKPCWMPGCFSAHQARV